MNDNQRRIVRVLAELVAAHDKARAHAERLRLDAECDRDVGLTGIIQDAAADHLDHLADMLITPELVSAFHAQADT